MFSLFQEHLQIQRYSNQSDVKKIHSLQVVSVPYTFTKNKNILNGTDKYKNDLLNSMRSLPKPLL